MTGADYEAACGRALRLLQHRMRSVGELRATLLGDGYEPALVEAVLARLEDLGLVDDEAFAAAFIRDGVNLRGHGRRRLRMELLRRGVAVELAERALDEHCAADDEAERADAIATSRAPRLRGLPVETARRRLAGQLERRGFGADAVAAALARHLPRDGTADE